MPAHRLGAPVADMDARRQKLMNQRSIMVHLCRATTYGGAANHRTHLIEQ
jgi:hypothetical protein